MKIEYAGHSSVFFHIGATVVAIDPWLMNNPICPEKLKNPKKIDLIALTHGHFDHAGETPHLAKHYGCKVVSTYELGSHMIAEGVSESHIEQMNKGGTLDFPSLGVSVSLTHAMHSNSYEMNGEIKYAGEACGIILKTKDVTIYHAGDTALFSDMQLIAEQYRPDVCLLPIGDRFTMGPEEAAQALMLIEPRIVIPIHHSTFPILTGTPEQFKIAVEKLGIDVEVVNLEPGGSYEIK